MNIQDIKQRFEIIGNSTLLNYALVTATKVAPTDITVLINGESGVGKEAFSKVIHSLSNRKHGPFIAVNCGAIPEGTIDSELFGHEKGSFTGALDTRKGYFETVNGGTIFLDEVGELPSATIPASVKSKLVMAIDRIKDTKLTYNQKIQVVGQVMDSLGIDKGEFNKMSSKLKGTMESSIKSIKEESPCWKGYKQVGMKDKGGKQVPNCVPA